MNDNIQNLVAEVFAIEDQGNRIVLRDKNKRSLGSFFKTKQSGEQTNAFEQYQNLGLKSGDTIEISFVERPYKDGMIKNIIGFREAGGRPVQRQSFTETKYSLDEHLSGEAEKMEKDWQKMSPKPKPEPTYEQPKQDAFGRRLAIHGMINGVLASGTKPTDITTEFISQIDMLENRINAFLSEPEDIAKQVPF